MKVASVAIAIFYRVIWSTQRRLEDEWRIFNLRLWYCTGTVLQKADCLS